MRDIALQQLDYEDEREIIPEVFTINPDDNDFYLPVLPVDDDAELPVPDRQDYVIDTDEPIQPYVPKPTKPVILPKHPKEVYLAVDEVLPDSRANTNVGAKTDSKGFNPLYVVGALVVIFLIYKILK